MKIRKQACKLTVEDFQTNPVWEFALDEEGEEGQDEATVRPYSTGKLADPAHGIIVRARFTLADGTTMFGCLTPPAPPSDDVGLILPLVITPAGHVHFWNGVLKPSPQQLSQDYAKLGRKPVDVFPLSFTSDVELVGSPTTGTLTGFMYLANETVDEVR